MSRPVSSPTFVGRSHELEALNAALGRARQGETAAVFVSGESGVGKSRLLAEFERAARGAGARVLAGACVDLGDAELPYVPVVAALRALARETEPDELEELGGPDRDELARLLPELGGALVTPGAVDPLAQVRLFEALLGLLARLGRNSPVVLAIEDLQWADPSTRGFLQFLVRNARRDPLMLVATYRSDALHRRHPLLPFLADTERAPGVDRVQLASFTRSELSAQVEAILEEPPESRLVDELLQRSQGNAFFVEELLAASRSGAGPIPETIRHVLTLRVERLAGSTQRALRLAAVAGSSVAHALLAAAADMPEEELGQAVREAIEHHVLVQDPAAQGYAFRHALLREALYDELLPNERRGVHRALAQALEDDERLATARQGAAAERAFHWFGAHEPAAALAASIEAGSEAEMVSAFAEASREFERALELWDAVPTEKRPPGVTLVDLLRRAAEAAFLAGDRARAASLARRALDSIDAQREPVAAALVHERLGRYLWVMGPVQPALAEYEAAAALVPPEPTGERARILAGQAQVLMLDGDCARASELAREAIDIARTVGSLRIECAALNTLGAAVGFLGARDEAIETLRRALNLGSQLGVQEELVRSYVNLGEMLDEAGRLEEAAECAVEGWQRLRTSIASQAPVVLGEAILRLVRLGRWDDADALADQAGDAFPLDFFGFAALTGLIDLETARGDLEAAEAHLDQARRAVAGGPGGMWRQIVAHRTGSLALARRRPEEAREAAAELLRTGMPSRSAMVFAVPAYVVGLRAEGDLATRARAAGDEAGVRDAVTRGGELLERVRAVADLDQWPLGPPPVELMLHVELAELELARAQGIADADAWAGHAARWEQLGRPPSAAYARWREAEAAVAGALPRQRALAPLQSARATADRLRAAPLLHEIDDLARRARIDLEGSAGAADEIAERLGLTARELDVLHLLADGRTNAQIGAALYISPKTASVHVSHIIAKLDVKTRIEAATAAHRLGLAEVSGRRPDL